VVGIFNEQTFYSDDRDLTVTFWLCISSKAKQAGKKNLFNHVFGASGMIKRGALSQLLQAMPRKDFKDWGKALGFEGSGLTHNNLHKEMKQWFSGQVLYVTLLQALLSRTPKASQSQLVQVRDYTAYDDELLKAVIHINSQPSSPAVCPVAYHAACWHQAGATKNVNQDNLLAAARGMIRTKIADGTYARVRLDKAKFGPEPSRAAVQQSRIASKPEDYELCYPKDVELLIKQTTMSLGASLGSVTVQDPHHPDRHWNWETLVQAHNAEFNPTGAAWVPGQPVKRPGEASNQSGSGFHLTPLVELCARIDAPDKEKLAKVVPVNQQYQLYVDEHGQLLVEGLQDAEWGPDLKVLKINGNYLVGAPATAFMQKEGAQYVPYQLEPKSLVFLSCKVPSADPAVQQSGAFANLPTGLLTLEAVYDLLAVKKAGRVELHKHTVTHSPGSGQAMTVAADEDCCLQVTAQPVPVGRELPMEKVASSINLMGLKGLLIVHQLQFDPQLKKLKPMFPTAVPQKACEFKAGDWHQL
jgi:hypothetical protein